MFPGKRWNHNWLRSGKQSPCCNILKLLSRSIPKTCKWLFVQLLAASKSISYWFPLQDKWLILEVVQRHSILPNRTVRTESVTVFPSAITLMSCHKSYVPGIFNQTSMYIKHKSSMLHLKINVDKFKYKLLFYLFYIYSSIEVF